MSLRARLLISFTVLLLAVIGTVGLVATRSIESILIDQIDRVLLGFAERGPVPAFIRVPEPGSAEETEEIRREVAEVLVDEDGNVVLSQPSGFRDDPDPLPDVSDLPAHSQLIYLDSVDGRLRYRAYAVALPLQAPLPEGLTMVWATPLSTVESASSALVRTLVLAGAGVLLLGGAATWWTVERSMRPVDQMVGTAEAIAGGDLSRRVPDLDPDTELGRLGRSLNEMLAHIEEAVATEREGRERLRRFIADASHELRTPLTAIAGYAELRRKGGLTTPDLEEQAWSRIESEGNRMASLIDDLLTLARLGQAQPLRLGEVDLARIARDAVIDHEVIDPTRPARLSGPEVLPLIADEERLHQVITNLLSNVRVHTPEGTSVEIRIGEEEDRVLIEAVDNGPGIPKSDLPHVFERLYRSDPSRSRRSGGSGLGLAIVEAIVTAHGGTVEAANVDSGGARITVRLPKAPKL